ncbi:MAG: hypothetical protein EHM79_00935 [Geobacter sp.]|nr:MAG: hypothetical protein EHM79_00935 [Geobacter sp.]
MVSKSENLIPGGQLIAKLGTDIFGLCYLVIKSGLTVLEERPKKSWFRRFRKPEHRTIDLEELLEIIQADPEKLRYKLFLLSETEKVPPHRVKRKDNGSKPDLRVVPGTESEMANPGLESKPLDSYKPEHSIEPNYELLLRETIEHHESDIKNSPNVFSLLGRVWFVKFNNQEWGLYPDHEKYKYVANLLSLSSETTGGSEGEHAIHIVGLVARVKGDELPPDNDVKMDDGDLGHMDLSKEITKEEIGRIGEIGDQLLDQLLEARKSQDQNRIHKIQNIIARYRSHLLKEYGIKTRVSDDEKRIVFKSLHRSSEEIEKVRQIVKNQIVNAIRDLSKHMPLFATHLQHSLKTSAFKASYSPEDQIVWTVST